MGYRNIKPDFNGGIKVNKCGSCIQFKNGCAFSESALPEDILKNYVACHDFLTKKDLDDAMDKAYEIAKRDIQ